MNPIISIEALYLQSRTKTPDIPILKDVIPYLTRSPGITGKTLAKVLGTKRAMLSAAIQLLTGASLNDMLRQWRLLNAMYLLRNTTLSYAQVATECGFSGNRTLSRFLEREIHCTAYEYRTGTSNRHKGIGR